MSSGWIKLGSFNNTYDNGIRIIFYEGNRSNPTRYEALIHGDSSTWAYKHGTGLNKIGYVSNTLYIKFNGYIHATVFSSYEKPSFDRLSSEPDGITYFS